MVYYRSNVTKLPDPPAGTIRASISGDYAGIAWANVFWLKATPTTAPSRTDMDTLATSILGTYQADFKPLMSSSWKISRCDLEFQVAPESTVPGLSVNTLAGTRSGTALPPQLCTCINWHTDFDHYRGGHARTYLPGPTVSDTLNNTYTSAYLASALSAAQSFRTALNAATAGSITSVTFIMLTRIRDGQPLATPVQRNIQSVSVRAVYATQRRRVT